MGYDTRVEIPRRYGLLGYDWIMPEVVTFNGVRFRRYPDSPHLCHRNYFTPGIGDKQRGVHLLHIEIWKYTHDRPVPEGCEIHHADFDPLNNRPTNLVCLTVAEHKAVHFDQAQARGRSPEAQAHLERIRPLAAPWHSSPEGREWHRQNAAKNNWGSGPVRDYECAQCGAGFQSRTAGGRARFCSNNCKSAWRRASGVDDIDRDCVACGTSFRVNRYVKVQCCSGECRRAHRARRAAACL